MISATYSAEDNKLRLYSDDRLDPETYTRVKAAGFIWAPQQKLFVAPAWNCEREDLCLELAGEIEAEGTTLAERAEAKADRLQAIAEKRAVQSGAYQRAAARIAERFAGGQPILVGHHSERRARKDRERVDAAMRAAVQAAEAVNYWNYRATGVAAHATYKNNPRTIARRIKTLLAELRHHQRSLNWAYHALGLWEKVIEAGCPAELVERYAGSRGEGGQFSSYGDYDALRKGTKTPEQVALAAIDAHSATIDNPRLARWLQHILNRLGYERSQLGPVPLFDAAALRAPLLQIFAREQGADSPKAEAIPGGFRLSSPVPLPAHVADGTTLELSSEQWCLLMQECGHTVVDKAGADRHEQAPLLNIDVAAIRDNSYGRDMSLPVEKMTKAEYMRINKDFRGVRLSKCKAFRYRVASKFNNGCRLVAVFLTDQKAHPVPDSSSIQVAAV